MAPNLPSTASSLRAKTSNFDRFAVLWLRVSNLLAMASQPAFDGLQPKSEDLQLPPLCCLVVSCLQPTSDGLSTCLRWPLT